MTSEDRMLAVKLRQSERNILFLLAYRDSPITNVLICAHTDWAKAYRADSHGKDM